MTPASWHRRNFMAQSINRALTSAMGDMSSSITQSITRALMQTQSSGSQSTTARNDTPQAVKDGAIPPRNRASGRAKSARAWKRAHAHEDSSNSDRSLEEEYDDSYMDHYSAEYSDSGSEMKANIATQKITAQGAEPAESGEGDDLQDPLGNPLFDPDNLRHPRSAEWERSTSR
ncbi:Hypothetical predicted protein [Pelobates cultripes]|uniref:Uncharacterized protein n=1 Tax=Pelobates cultripes TaxID=61616 RepID=A0AAD1T5H1_PELCU|nr:Hypothetical predicted protein [Pelobates cultripes]